MPIKKLRQFLDGNGVKYTVVNHLTAYTALEVAEFSHLPGKEVAKTVIIELDGELAMVVVPASKSVDFEYLKEGTACDRAELVQEKVFKERFPDCELGAMPPFGHLYGMRLIVDQRLTEDREIAFNAGNHRELIVMRFDDYQKLAKPKIVDITGYFREREKVLR